MGFQIYVGDELVWEGAEAHEVTGVRLNTSRGEQARINSPMEEQRIMLSLDFRSDLTSNYLDIEEAKRREAEAAVREANSPENQRRAETAPTAEELGEEGTNAEAMRQQERKDVSSTPLADETAGTLGSNTLAPGAQGLVRDRLTPSGQTQAEVDHPSSGADTTPPDADSTSADERELVERSSGNPFTGSSIGSSEGGIGQDSPQGGPDSTAQDSGTSSS